MEIDDYPTSGDCQETFIGHSRDSQIIFWDSHSHSRDSQGSLKILSRESLEILWHWALQGFSESFMGTV